MANLSATQRILRTCWLISTAPFPAPALPADDSDDVSTNDSVPPPHVISDIQFEEEDIIDTIDELSCNAAASPDGFPAVLFTCKEQLAKPLYQIYRTSLDQGTVPTSLKKATIVPVHKGGSRGPPKNYRPSALTSHLSNVFEQEIREELVAFLEDNQLLNPGQHGFRTGRSCLSQLLTHLDEILNALEGGNNVDVVYLDFSKAFNKVDFLVTLRKLSQLGVQGTLHAGLASFLTDRVQSVIVDGISSHTCQVTSGVPQGSVLEPLLFLILIRDIDQNVESSFVSSFADDTRIGKAVGTTDDVNVL